MEFLNGNGKFVSVFVNGITGGIYIGDQRRIIKQPSSSHSLLHLSYFLDLLSNSIIYYLISSYVINIEGPVTSNGTPAKILGTMFVTL